MCQVVACFRSGPSPLSLRKKRLAEAAKKASDGDQSGSSLEVALSRGVVSLCSGTGYHLVHHAVLNCSDYTKERRCPIRREALKDLWKLCFQGQ